MTLALFQKNQTEFCAHIRNPKNNPIPTGIEARRMKVYSDLLYSNIEGFIVSGFPIIHSIFSKKNWHRMIRDFFENHTCQTPYFLEISKEFIDYLENERKPQSSDPLGLVELAHYEWVELALHVCAEEINMENINANGDLLNQPPAFSPLAWPMMYQFPVHTLSKDNLLSETPKQPTYLVVYRNRKDAVNFLEINPVTARLIALLQDNAHYSGLNAIEHIYSELPQLAPDVIKQGGEQALKQLQGYGIILGTTVN